MGCWVGVCVCVCGWTAERGSASFLSESRKPPRLTLSLCSPASLQPEPGKTYFQDLTLSCSLSVPLQLDPDKHIVEDEREYIFLFRQLFLNATQLACYSAIRANFFCVKNIFSLSWFHDLLLKCSQNLHQNNQEAESAEYQSELKWI